MPSILKNWYQKTAAGKVQGKPLTSRYVSLYVAAGTSPNTIYQSEYPDTFVMDKWFFQRYEPEWTNGTLNLVPMAMRLFPNWANLRRSHPIKKTANLSAFTATTIRSMPVTSSKRWPVRKTAIRMWLNCLRKNWQHLNPAQQAERDAALTQAFSQQTRCKSLPRPLSPLTG